MHAPKEDIQGISLTNIGQVLRTLGSAIAVATFCYFIACFAFAFAFARNLDIDLLHYLSFEDYLITGIGINLYVVLTLTILIFTLRASYYTIPKNTDETEPIKQWANAVVQTKGQKWISYFVNAALLISAVWLFISNVRHIDESVSDHISIWYSLTFWLVVSAAVLFNILSLTPLLRTTWLIASASLVLILILANILAGHLYGGSLQNRTANIKIHLIGTTIESIIGTHVLPTAKGIVYLPSDICSPPTNKNIHLISWSAVGLVENISASAEHCAPPLDSRQPPLR